ncbi:MAG: butanol dehydrogenase [Rhodospirillaceae bacterium]|nr:butanol dehydrogenase [Rhodospirillaceae bacterium]
MSEESESGKGGLWKALRRPSGKSLGALLAFGIVLGVGGWGGFNWSMELTNTEDFCISCHEMRDFVFEEYKETVHYNNRTGVRATCPDCHVPKEWVYKVRRKIQASNELLHKVLGTIDTKEKFEGKRLELAKNVWATMKETDSRECRNCHSFEFMDLTKQERRSQKRHEKALNKGQTCIDCHKGVAHELPEGYDEDS